MTDPIDEGQQARSLRDPHSFAEPGTPAPLSTQNPFLNRSLAERTVLGEAASADGSRVLASSMAFIDATALPVSVLPRLRSEFGVDLAAVQWVLNGYACWRSRR